MNDSELCLQGSRCYEQLKVMEDMNDFRSCAQGYKSYEQLRAMIDIYGSIKMWNSTYNKSCQSIHLIIEYKEWILCKFKHQKNFHSQKIQIKFFH